MSPAADTLIEALGSASTPAAQDSLVRLQASNTTDAALRRRIITALSRTPRPDQSSIHMFEKTLKTDPFSEPALLGLGTYARRLRDGGDSESADSIGGLLVDRLGAATNLRDRLTVLRAITNSGYSPALDRVRPYLTDSENQTRVDAVRALQSMRDPRVDDLIADRLLSDSASEVRISALSAAKVREPTDTLATAVESAASKAADPHVRYRAVEILAQWITRRPDVRPALERVANDDVEPRIRERAQSAL